MKQPEILKDGFLGVGAEGTDYGKALAVVLPVPYEATVSYGGGTRQGPSAIIEASHQVECFDEELKVDFTRGGVVTLLPIESDVRGPEYMVERVRRAARACFRDKKLLLTLGGEHSITTGLVAAAKSVYRNLSVLHLDAHADMRRAYQGSEYSHATVGRRIVEMPVPIVQAGVRSFSAEEYRFMRSRRLEPFSPARIAEYPRNLDPLTNKFADWTELVSERLTERVYVTIDVDVFDPAFAPGTGTPEPGGLDWFTVTHLLRRICTDKTVIGADIVEVSPTGTDRVTETLAARLAAKIITYASGMTNLT